MWWYARRWLEAAGRKRVVGVLGRAARAVRVAAWVGGDEGVVEAEVVAELEGGLQVGEVVLVVDAHHIEQDCGVGDSAGEEPGVRVGRRGRACSEQEVSALLKGGVGEGVLRV